jgi:hypothetical protein
MTAALTASMLDNRWRCLTALLLVASLLASPQGAAAPATPSASADELAGLWKAKRRFGPDARGPLVIERTGTTYVADMNGRTIPVQSEKGKLTFELPSHQGTFRGKLTQQGEAIAGHWFPHDSEEMSFQLASPFTTGRRPQRSRAVPRMEHPLRQIDRRQPRGERVTLSQVLRLALQPP